MLAFLHLRQDLAAARQLRDVAISGLQTAQDAQKTAQDTLQFVQTRWEEAVQAKDNEAAEKWEEKVKRAEEKVERAEVKVETAEKKVDRAKVELDRAKQEVDKAKEAAKASVPAGRGQAGASACAVVAALPHGRRAFSCGPTVFAFWGHALLSARIPLVVKPFSLCWLAALRGAGGALGCFRFHANLVALRVLPTLQNGVSVLGSRWGVGLFCARFALSKLRLLLFEARLSGYCVREGGVKGVNPGCL